MMAQNDTPLLASISLESLIHGDARDTVRISTYSSFSLFLHSIKRITCAPTIICSNRKWTTQHFQRHIHQQTVFHSQKRMAFHIYVHLFDGEKYPSIKHDFPRKPCPFVVMVAQCNWTTNTNRKAIISKFYWNQRFEITIKARHTTYCKDIQRILFSTKEICIYIKHFLLKIMQFCKL